MLLGSGELGKEFTIAAQRLGQYIIAVDNYDDAPAMHVADCREVIDMLNGDELERIVKEHRPDIIVPEIEAIRTDKLYDFENSGIHVVPCAKAVNYTMNRKQIRDLAAKELGLKTADYRYARSLDELKEAAKAIGFPAVIKPLMSSSGKGQSVARTAPDLEKSWNDAVSKSRGDLMEVIIEEFIPFDSEITLLTLTQKNGNTLYCPPIGHRQERGDYMESWQPAMISDGNLEKACSMADRITKALGGEGIWGVEFFLTKDDVYFSELSPRPHDTGMVTLAGTQDLNEFELHLRAILGMEIPAVNFIRPGASAVILSENASEHPPSYTGMETACKGGNTDIRIFGKPSTRKYRRMGVALSWATSETPADVLRTTASEVAGQIKVVSDS
jgi:phosphoribosylglycinamide formyltransferase 2